MFSDSIQSQSKKAVSLALSFVFALSSFGSVCSAQAQAQTPNKASTARRAPQYTQAQLAAYYAKQRALQATRQRILQNYAADTLMITTTPGASEDQILESIKNAHCSLANILNMGSIKVLVLKTEKGKLAEAEKLLRQDKNIGLMQRNYKTTECWTPPSDPQFANKSDDFLALVKAPKAWALGATGSGATIAILDTGCQATTTDIAGKTEKGYDSTTWDARLALATSALAIAAGVSLPGAGVVGGLLGALGINKLSSAINRGGNVDRDTNATRGGHGTECATVAAGSINGDHGVGVAPGARIYPIMDGKDGTDDFAVMQALAHLATGGPKLVNISQGPFGDVTDKPILHLFFKAYHDVFGGIIFVSAGNAREQLGGGRHDYLNVVSMTYPSGQFIDDDGAGNGSGRGDCITFAAQGSQCWTVNKSNMDVPMDGTSFSSPTCAGVAALIWGANPGLSNTQVEYIMKKTAYMPTGIAPNSDQYGYGIPDAEAAVKMAQGM